MLDRHLYVLSVTIFNQVEETPPNVIQSKWGTPVLKATVEQ